MNRMNNDDDSEKSTTSSSNDTKISTEFMDVADSNAENSVTTSQVLSVIETNDDKASADESKMENKSLLKPVQSLITQQTKNLLRKTWSTVVQKNDEFNRVFKDLIPNEPAIADFSCALKKDILIQGKLFITKHHICFYSNLLVWETTLVIKFKDIKSIEKDKVARLIPNSVKISLENERHFFTSLNARDKTYEILTKIWKKELENKPVTDQELKLLLRNSFIEDLGYNSEREDLLMKSRQSDDMNGLPNQNNILIFNAENQKISPRSEIVTMNSSYSDRASLTGVETNELYKLDSQKRSSSGHIPLNFSNSMDQTMDSTQFKLPSKTNVEKPDQQTNNQIKVVNSSSEFIRKSNSVKNQENNLTIKKDNDSISSAISFSDIENNNSNKLKSKAKFDIEMTTSTDSLNSSSPVYCECSEHLGKEMLNGKYNLSPNYIFECIFGKTEFCIRYWETSNFSDMNVSEWRLVEGHQTRQLDFSVSLNRSVGFKQCKNSETQKVLKYIPNKCIVIESSSVTYGVPYSDCFVVVCRFCITKLDNSQTNLRVHVNIKYLQKPVFFVKAFIEKTTLSALAVTYQYLDTNLPKENEVRSETNNDISAFIKIEDQTDKKNDLPDIPVTPVKKSRVRRRLVSSRSEEHSLNNKNKKRLQDNTTQSDHDYSQIKTFNNLNTPQMVPIQTFSFLRWQVNVDTLVRLFIIAMVFLMIINGILYLKLVRIENFAKELNTHPKIAELNNNLNRNVNKIDIENESNQLKELFLSTAKALSKMSETLNDWNQSFTKKNYLNDDEKQNL